MTGRKASVEMMESHIFHSKKSKESLRDMSSRIKGSVELMEQQIFHSKKSKESLRDIISSKKGSVEMMEYMFLTLFVIVIVIAFVIFLSWWNVSQMNVERAKMELDKTLVVAKTLLSSPFLAREDSMLDDGKLTAIQEMGEDACLRIRSIYGADWFAVVRLLDGSNETLCGASNYPGCNYWVFCKDARKNYRSYVVPVNIYRNIGTVLTTGVLGRSYVGSMEAGVYL